MGTICMPSFLHGLLIISVTFVCVLGSRVTVGFNHSHEAVAEHAHHHGDVDGGHGGHSHEHESPLASDESEDNNHGGESDHHSHIVALGTDVPFIATNFPQVRGVAWTNIGLALADPDLCPEGPYFALIKPPQLG